jgi:2-succinyl-5-enolpyruvyl-6-hydroxy-3-cyclohexene-1-carboxylate synthase
MKKSINRNILWAEIFAAQLEKCGLKNICFSPGSRSTPLTFAFASRKKIKTHVILDERSSGFFALGLAKKLNQPVAVVTTSGTAVAELYPAIVEAYQSRIPLIICTADRPANLRFSGANQTINQENIFANHIRMFKDLGLPSLSMRKLNNLKQVVVSGYSTASKNNPGPVHFNLPFDKPFEPDNYTDKMDFQKISTAESLLSIDDSKVNQPDKSKNSRVFNKLLQILNNSKRGIIFCGPGFYTKEFIKECLAVSNKLNFPILADGSSNIRFLSYSQNKLIHNFPNMFRTREIRKAFDAEVIIQIGKAPTSQGMLSYFEETHGKIFLVNEFGDNHDPSNSSEGIFKMEPLKFLKILKQKIVQTNPLSNELTLFSKFQKLDKEIEVLKEQFLAKSKFPFEGKVIYEIANSIRSTFNLLVSNSMPIRDLDFFVSGSKAKINLYCSRGASGIDGITSTAMGIADGAKEPTILVTGDLAFLHDLNGLALHTLLDIPLTIVLLNNNGGGIFEMLPIAKHSNIFGKYFKTPHNLTFKNFVTGFGGNHLQIKSWTDFQNKIYSSLNNKKLNVLEIKTNSTQSLKLRKGFWDAVNSKCTNFINEFNKSKN